MNTIKIVKDELNKKFKNFKTAFFGTINSVIKSSSTTFVSISPEEEIRDIRILSPYGLYSLPNVGQSGQVIFNNSTKKATLIGVDNFDAKPIDIGIGEVILFNSNGGNYILLKNNGDVEIKGNNITIDGNSVAVTSSIFTWNDGTIDNDTTAN